MPKFEAVFYDKDFNRIDTLELPSAINMIAALKAAADYLPTIQGNAHVVEVNVEEISDDDNI